MGDPLRPLPLLVRLSRETVKIIRQNILWFAFVVNAVGIVFTSWLWPLLTPESWFEQSPIAAVIYHQLGSLAVLLNSMRLLWFERSSTSPAWAGLRGRFRDVDNWVSRYLDIDELLHGLEHHWKPALATVLILLVGLYIASGLRVVAPDEVALVRHFGHVTEELPPGWYWRYPWPVDDVTRVSQRARSVEVGFREAPGNAGSVGALTWASAHRRENRIPDEAMMLTGDGNLVDLLVSVRYKVTDPRVYLFEVKDADEIIRASAESTLRGMVAGKPFFQLLTVERGEFQDEALRRLKAACSRYGSHGLGVEFDSIAVVDLHPPSEVVGAYYEVAKAMEWRDQKVNAATERATRKLKAAAAEAERIASSARAGYAEKTKQAEGQRDRFIAHQRARRTLTDSQEYRLASRALGALWRGEPEGKVEERWRQERAALVTANAALADFRIYWETFGKALTGRELVLIDADQVRGQRNLMLFDPDQFRMPIPMWVPPGARGTTRMPGQPDEGP
jgi:Cu+-exporting ATPase